MMPFKVRPQVTTEVLEAHQGEWCPGCDLPTATVGQLAVFADGELHGTTTVRSCRWCGATSHE